MIYVARDDPSVIGEFLRGEGASDLQTTKIFQAIRRAAERIEHEEKVAAMTFHYVCTLSELGSRHDADKDQAWKIHECKKLVGEWKETMKFIDSNSEEFIKEWL